MPPKAKARGKKQSVIVKSRGTLGESSSHDDDSELDETNHTPSNRPKQSEAFRTPDADGTDYGLEFTTSRIANPSPTRCSTLRTGSSQEEQSAPTRSNETSHARSERTEVEGYEDTPTTSVTDKKLTKQKTKQPANSRTRKTKQAEESIEATEQLKAMSLAADETENVENEGYEDTQTTSGTTDKITKQKAKQSVKSRTRKTKLAEESIEATEQLKAMSLAADQTENDENEESSVPSKTALQKTATSEPTVTAAKPKEAAQQKQQLKNKKSRKQSAPQQMKKFMREVKLLQNRTDLLVPRLPFSRLIRELIMDCSSEVTKITPTALEALQVASEMYLTQRLQDAYMLTLHRGRVTLDVRDMQLINFLKMDM